MTTVNEFRDYVYRKALQYGDDLMPDDVVEIIKRADNGGKFKNITTKFDNEWAGLLSLLVDVYESCGFTLPDNSITRENFFKYF